SSEDDEEDEDDDMDIEADEEEEEHPALADSVVVASTAADQAPSAEKTKPFETDESAATPPPHPAYRMTAIISIPAPVPMPAWEDRPEVTLPPQKKLGIALGPGYEVGESSYAAGPRPAGGLRADYGFVATMDKEIMHDPEREVGYGITDSWDEIVETLQGAPVSTDTELGGYMREFETRVRQDTDEIYMRLDDEQSERQLLAGRLNMLFRDRRTHAYTRHLMETEARMSREAWETDCDFKVAEDRSYEIYRGYGDEDSPTGTGDSPTGTGDSFAGTGYHITGTAGTHWRSYTARKQMAPKRTTRSTADQETINTTTVTNAQLQVMIDQGVTAALAARDALRSTNVDDSHNSGTGVRRTERATRECTYIDFLKCQPLPFKGTEGVASLSQWFEKMESVFHINNCAVENQVKFATCTLHSVALTWWNTHVKTVGNDRQGVTAALAARDALRSTNGDDSHNFRIGVRRTEQAARECTYTEFLKCQPLPFKGTKGVASLL
nr:hypothetical protein [Tanacetum cinerariifolium]